MATILFAKYWPTATEVATYKKIIHTYVCKYFCLVAFKKYEKFNWNCLIRLNQTKNKKRTANWLKPK